MICQQSSPSFPTKSSVFPRLVQSCTSYYPGKQRLSIGINCSWWSAEASAPGTGSTVISRCVRLNPTSPQPPQQPQSQPLPRPIPMVEIDAVARQAAQHITILRSPPRSGLVAQRPAHLSPTTHHAATHQGNDDTIVIGTVHYLSMVWDPNWTLWALMLHALCIMGMISPFSKAGFPAYWSITLMNTLSNGTFWR